MRDIWDTLIVKINCVIPLQTIETWEFSRIVGAEKQLNRREDLSDTIKDITDGKDIMTFDDYLEIIKAIDPLLVQQEQERQAKI